MGPRADLDGYGKSRPPRFDPLTVQFVPTCFTSYATPVHLADGKSTKRNNSLHGR